MIQSLDIRESKSSVSPHSNAENGGVEVDEEIESFNAHFLKILYLFTKSSHNLNTAVNQNTF